MLDRPAEQTWKSPPAPIAQILEAPLPPTVSISPDHQWLIELERSSLRPIAELAEPELGLAGVRINPKLNTPARYHPAFSLRVKPLLGGVPELISLPPHAGIGYLHWSPDSRKLAFTLLQATGLELWVMDLVDRSPQRLTEATLNATYGTPYRWMSEQTLLCKMIPDSRMSPIAPPIPLGPIIQENLGRKSANRTYTNLLQNAHDEALFEHYFTSTLEQVTLDGRQTRLVNACLIEEAHPSPDGRFILLKTLHRPFSYQLPARRFPRCIQVLDQAGMPLQTIADLPLADQISTKFDAVRPGRRHIGWRSDRPATLYWVESLDDGDPTRDVPFRDAVFDLEAPFTDAPRQLWQSEYRFRRLLWGREDVALAWEREHDHRQLRLWQINPSQPDRPPQLLCARSFEDQYSDPGMPLLTIGIHHRSVLQFTPDGNGFYFAGRGASPAGVYPFLDRRELHTGSAQRLWQCQPPYFESILTLLDDDAQTLITYRQSQTEPPNYFVYHGRDSQPVPLTAYPDPAPELAGIYKEVVQYQRADGVQLSAKLYLPANYEVDRDGALPTIFWVYPAEFKDKALAGQMTTAENTFSRPRGASALFLLTQGYAILDDPSLPIVGEGDAEPNDTYLEQLISSVEAAIDYLVHRGVSDRNRLGIGGHSYGGFTTANLLAHTNLFQAGIARSGAYNRSLTPFGFQGEQRNFWEATETYTQMSPFTHAAKVDAPLLLIHGANDSNPGTYPIQTERLYEALKGLGATVRWVSLPLEDHGYRSREGVGHVLWEMVEWCDRYVKKNEE
ncbi:MAG: S9 family peptidase [Leptolyngbyaceae cyanobacterium CSU_1_3]|nr:S9 family peptidase [Leptolyngbyaceae cyanobacterium CSU_1_3]